MRQLVEVYMIVKDRHAFRRLMIRNDVTQRELADAAGWRSHSYVGRLLRGELQTLTYERARRIAKYLKVPLHDLFLARVATDDHRIGDYEDVA